jgi:hypothetical protein
MSCSDAILAMRPVSPASAIGEWEPFAIVSLSLQFNYNLKISCFGLNTRSAIADDRDGAQGMKYVEPKILPYR